MKKIQFDKFFSFFQIINRDNARIYNLLPNVKLIHAAEEIPTEDICITDYYLFYHQENIELLALNKESTSDYYYINIKGDRVERVTIKQPDIPLTIIEQPPGNFTKLQRYLKNITTVKHAWCNKLLYKGKNYTNVYKSNWLIFADGNTLNQSRGITRGDVQINTQGIARGADQINTQNDDQINLQSYVNLLHDVIQEEQKAIQTAIDNAIPCSFQSDVTLLDDYNSVKKLFSDTADKEYLQYSTAIKLNLPNSKVCYKTTFNYEICDCVYFIFNKKNTILIFDSVKRTPISNNFINYLIQL